MIRICIAGSRNFTKYSSLTKVMKVFTAKYPPEEIILVTGCAEGADALGERWAKQHSVAGVASFPAKWDDMTEPCVKKKRSDGTEYNALAGHKRNESMANYADYILVFWNKVSPGSKQMISICKKLNKNLYVFDFSGNLIDKNISGDSCN